MTLRFKKNSAAQRGLKQKAPKHIEHVDRDPFPHEFSWPLKPSKKSMAPVLQSQAHSLSFSLRARHRKGDKGAHMATETTLPLEAAPDAIVIVDQNGNMVNVNSLAENMCEFPLEVSLSPLQTASS